MRARLTLSLRAVSVRRGDKWALRGISWRLRPGERWALIGDNGAGKTQLLKLLSGDVWPTPAGGRSYWLGRAEVDLIEAKTRIAYIGAEQQDKYARYGWNLRVRDLIATGLHRTDLLLRPATPPEARRVAATIRACGLGRQANREFLTLSYGQKRLALLARALVQKPDWLLLDEFYNGLDAHYRGRIDALLDAARRRGQSWIATSHRAADVPRGTRCLLELAGGRVRTLKAIRPTDLARLAARASEPRGVTAPRGAAPRIPASRAAGRGAATAASEGAAAVSKGATVGVRRSAAAGAALVRLSKVDLYVGYRLVLRDVEWQLLKGEHWAVYGANGAGKSSFLKLLYGDLSPALGGRIERGGFPKGTPISEWKRGVGYVSPELQSDYAVDVRVLDLVASGRHSSIGLVDEPTVRDLEAARHWLRFFGLLPAAKRRPRELSYGELRRALIARAMAADPRILLLDEPLTGLDPRQRASMKRLLERLMKQATLVIAVHHAEDLPRGMTRGLHLHNRRAYAIDF
jgi:molybdate transport system ATP-binding protein